MSLERFADARAHFVAAGDAYYRLGLRGFNGFELNAANLAAWLGDYADAERLYRKGFEFSSKNAAARATSRAASV